MGRTRGRPKKGQLADMAVYPEPEPRYSLPPDEECDEWAPYHEHLAPGHRLTIAQRFLKGTGKLVRFSINQGMLTDDGWHDVARIDTSEGEVHRHQFTSSGGDHRTEIEVIPADYGEEVIDRWFDPSLDRMKNDWGDNVRRWHRDGT